MKAKLCFLLAAVLLAVVPGRAETTAQPARNESVLHITIVEPISYASGSTYSDFDRLDVALAAVAKQRNWPTLLKIERLAGNATTAYDPEVRIVLEGVKHQEGDEYLFRARLLVMAGGKETDLGLVSYRHGARYVEGLDTLYEKIFRGAADVIADKVEPLLFPAASPGADNSPLHVTVDGITLGESSTYTDYDRFARGIQEVTRERKWSRPITVEKLIGGTPRYANELRINFERTVGDSFIAHAILILDGKRQDLGDIIYSHDEHSYGRNEEARRLGVFKGGAAAVADRVEPLVFPAARPAAKNPALHVTVNLRYAGNLDNAYTDYNRLERAIQEIVEERKWSRPVTVEKLVGGVPRYDDELRINLDSVGGEKFNARVTLILDGKKQDLGAIAYRHEKSQGYALNKETAVQEVFKGGAGAIADLIEPLLFPTAHPELHVTVIDSISSPDNAYTDFDRLDYALQKMAEQRKWPTKIKADRLAGNTPNYTTELRVTIQRVNREPISDYVIRAWVILVLDGKKHDFGVVTGRYSARMGLSYEDTYENLFRVGADAIADKVEPLLFPNLKKADPKPKK